VCRGDRLTKGSVLRTQTPQKKTGRESCGLSVSNLEKKKGRRRKEREKTRSFTTQRGGESVATQKEGVVPREKENKRENSTGNIKNATEIFDGGGATREQKKKGLEGDRQKEGANMGKTRLRL